MSSGLHAPKIRVLVAEADYQECRRIENSLTDLGADVETVSNGLDAIGMLRRDTFHLLLLAASMPVMDGGKTARILRADLRFHDLPIVAMSEPLNPPEAQSLLGFGFTRLLWKPLSAEALRAELDNAAPYARMKGGAPIMRACAGDGASPPEKGKAGASGRTGAKDALKADGAANGDGIPDLDGFDITQGIARLMGNKKLYMRLLQDFAQTLRQCVEEVREAERAYDTPALLASIHKIKGMSGNVAAVRLYEYVIELEKQLKTAPKAAQREPLQMLYPLMEATIAALADLSPAPTPPTCQDEGENADTAKTPPPAADAPRAAKTACEACAPLTPALEAALRETLCRIEEYATTAWDAFEKVDALLGEREAASRSAIKAHLESFAFEEAKDELLKLTRSLGVANI